MSGKQKVLVVDDFPENIELIRNFFKNDPYEILSAHNGFEALNIVNITPPDIILLDVIMPGLDGFEVSKKLKGDVKTKLIPIIMVTALEDSESKIKGIQIGVDDFITKPIRLIEMKARVASLLRVKKYTDELENAEKIIFSLALAVEAKDQYTLGHCNRISNYGAILAERMKFKDEDIINIRRGAILHDIGKIAISDQILLKPGPLNPDEFEIIKTHPIVGENICQPLKTLQPTLPIIRSHQERFNGSGYPDNLSGEDIPLFARLVSIIDCFDALTTDRPYRKALQKEEALNLIKLETDEGLWDPHIFKMFIKISNEKNIEQKINENSLGDLE